MKTRLSGYLRATCAADGDTCKLRRKEFKTPIHISKPYWDGSHLLVNVMSPTAGLLEGDSVEVEIDVESDASLVLSNPSALRVHKMQNGGEAVWTQQFRVRANGFLECNPEWLILQEDSSFRQSTEIVLDSDATLFFVEAIAPGRIAHGERFRFDLFRNRLSLYFNGALAALEKHRIDPNSGTANGWSRSANAYPFYISIFCVSKSLTESSPIWEKAHGLQSASIRIGSSRLAAGPCWNIKILATNPTEARDAMNELRNEFYTAVGRNAAPLRRS